MKIVVKILFPDSNNADVKFTELKQLTKRFYILAEALSITSCVDCINKKELAKLILNKNSKTLFIHISTPKVMTIHFCRIAQINTI